MWTELGILTQGLSTVFPVISLPSPKSFLYSLCGQYNVRCQGYRWALRYRTVDPTVCVFFFFCEGSPCKTPRRVPGHHQHPVNAVIYCHYCDRSIIESVRQGRESSFCLGKHAEKAQGATYPLSEPRGTEGKSYDFRESSGPWWVRFACLLGCFFQSQYWNK